MIDEAFAEYMANCRRFMRTINAHQIMDFGRNNSTKQNKNIPIKNKNIPNPNKYAKQSKKQSHPFRHQ